MLHSSSKNSYELDADYFGIVGPLLENEGYRVERASMARDPRIDLIGRRRRGVREEVVGAEFKHYRGHREVPANVLESAVTTAHGGGLDQLMLVANRPFSRSLLDLAARKTPVEVKLLDLHELETWITRVASTLSDVALGILDMTRDFLIRLARVLAKKPDEASKLEWRLVEQLLGEVFSGLGFTARVTPATNDGGKDVVLSARVGNEELTYLVELKHWFADRVGTGPVKEFIQVIGQEQAQGGLFLASSGFYAPTFEILAEITRPVALGDGGKLSVLCQTFVRAESGLWSVPANPFDILCEDARVLPHQL